MRTSSEDGECCVEEVESEQGEEGMTVMRGIVNKSAKSGTGDASMASEDAKMQAA